MAAVTEAPSNHAPAAPTVRSAVRLAIEAAWAAAIADGTLPSLPEDVAPVPVEVERPADPEHGDLATNLAMKLARPYRMAPLAIATALATELTKLAAADAATSPIASAEVAAPGFLNLRLTDAALEVRVDGILAAPGSWGRISAGTPRVVNVEFVSANPTGPLHIGNARGAFVGDLLCRVLEAGGQQVTREYYFNDSGGQIRNLGASVVAIRRGEPLPEDGYKGDYVVEIADALPDDVWAAAIAGDDPVGVVGHWAAGTGSRGDRGEPRRARGPIRRLDERGQTP